MPQQPEQLDSTIQIVTPENIAFEYRVAGPFRRLPAFLMDLAIRMGFFLLVLFLLSMLMPISGFGLMSAGVMIILFLLEWFYGGVFETLMNGQTPGKWAMGLRVLTTDGRPISGMQAVLRNILRAVDTMPWISLQALGSEAPMYAIWVFMVGLIAMSMNRRYQRMGDLVCGTMVVIEERTWLKGVVKLQDPRAAQLAAYLPASLDISRSLAQALALYVDRRERLPQVRRKEIARHLAEPLLRKFNLREDTSYDLLLCAMYYRAFIADRATPADAPAAPAPPQALQPSSAGQAPADIVYVQPGGPR